MPWGGGCSAAGSALAWTRLMAGLSPRCSFPPPKASPSSLLDCPWEGSPTGSILSTSGEATCPVQEEPRFPPKASHVASVACALLSEDFSPGAVCPELGAIPPPCPAPLTLAHDRLLHVLLYKVHLHRGGDGRLCVGVLLLSPPQSPYCQQPGDGAALLGLHGVHRPGKRRWSLWIVLGFPSSVLARAE